MAVAYPKMRIKLVEYYVIILVNLRKVFHLESRYRRIILRKFWRQYRSQSGDFVCDCDSCSHSRHLLDGRPA